MPDDNLFRIPEVVSASYTRYPFPSPLNPTLHLSENDWSNRQDATHHYPTLRPMGDIPPTSDTVIYLTHKTSKITLSSPSNDTGTASPKHGSIRTPRRTKQYISYFDQLERRYVDPSKLC